MAIILLFDTIKVSLYRARTNLISTQRINRSISVRSTKALTVAVGFKTNVDGLEGVRQRGGGGLVVADGGFSWS